MQKQHRDAPASGFREKQADLAGIDVRHQAPISSASGSYSPGSITEIQSSIMSVRHGADLTNRVVDLTPALDPGDVAVHRGEVRAHRYDGDVAPPSIAPSGNIAGPLVVAAT